MYLLKWNNEDGPCVVKAERCKGKYSGVESRMRPAQLPPNFVCHTEVTEREISLSTAVSFTTNGFIVHSDGERFDITLNDVKP